MRVSLSFFLLPLLAPPLYAAAPQWKHECVGYYQLQLPARIAAEIFPAGNFIHPPLFDAVYGGYQSGIVSKRSMPADLQAYRNQVKARKQADNLHVRQYAERLARMNNRQPESYLIGEYPQAFSLYEPNSHTVYINRGKRWYHFWYKDQTLPSLSAEQQRRNNEARVQRLNADFRARTLFDVPATPGFCLPFGFIAADSGREPHNVAATWRLNDHPQVTIHFQTMGLPSAPTSLTDKETITQLWARRYQRPPVAKTVIDPQWRVTRMAGRFGLSTLIESTFTDGTQGYDYIAFVAGDAQTRNETPDLLLHVTLDSRRKANNVLMTKAALEEMAEKITASVQRR